MVMATKPVFGTADEPLRQVVDLAMAPPQTDEEKRRLMDNPRMDAISKFAIARRRELEELRVNRPACSDAQPSAPRPLSGFRLRRSFNH
jgi:hypothetical protein